MNSTSPANSSISTTAIVGGGGSSSNNTATDEFHFPTDLISIQDRKDEASLGLLICFLMLSTIFSYFVSIIVWAIWIACCILAFSLWVLDVAMELLVFGMWINWLCLWVIFVCPVKLTDAFSTLSFWVLASLA